MAEVPRCRSRISYLVGSKRRERIILVHKPMEPEWCFWYSLFAGAVSGMICAETVDQVDFP